ncbi:DUF1800 domain-containing protein [Photobacterium indicum]|uniref:DUF1800 domain-containing protein n=1 Tax=Photobacterium indicum TaxID=81447 RepID=UPI003D0A4C3E
MTDTTIYSDDRQQCAKFLYRGSFGPQQGEIDQLQQNGFDAWLNQQFSSSPSYHLPKAQAFALLTNDDVNDNMRLGAWWQCALEANDQLRQRMAYALSQIFVVSKHGIGNRHAGLANYYDILVEHAFGNFRDILEKVTLSPMMGRYLTLEGSQKANPDKNTFPDENYAREVMQLFSLGLWKLRGNGKPKLDTKGNKIPTYTQHDVEELSRVFTGWRRTNDLDPMYADNNRHDTDEKIVLKTRFAAGQSAEQDLQQALDVLFNHANTPMFIANLLIKRFVTSNPRNGYISRVAKAFKDNGEGIRGDLQATLKAVLTDADVFKGRSNATGNGRKASKQHFGLLKEPIITVANQARALNMTSVGERWWNFQGTENNLGQAPLTASSVFNFYTSDFAPQGEIADLDLTAPEFNILTTDIMRRIHNRFWSNILAYKNTKDKHWVWNRSEYEQLEASPTDYVALINERFFGGLMSDELTAYLTDMLINKISPTQIDNRIQSTLYVAVTSPEFFCQE